MRPTALGALVAGTAWLALLLAFLLGTLAPAILGVVLLFGVETARWRLRRTPVQAVRHLPGAVELGQRATIRTEATAEHALPLRVEDRVDVPLRLVEEQSVVGRGRATHSLEVEATDIGTAQWRSVAVHVGDPWGLHAVRRDVPLRGSLQVSPEADWVAAGRRAGQRHHDAATRPPGLRDGAGTGDGAAVPTRRPPA